MKPSLSRIGWTLLCCAAAALALATAAQHPATHNKDNKPLLPEPEVIKSQPAKGAAANSPAVERKPAQGPAANSPIANRPGATSSVAKSPTTSSQTAHGPGTQPPALQHPLNKKAAKVQKYFIESTSSLQDAETRIRNALETANKQRKNFPDQAASLDPQIARLNDLLSHVHQLQQQASRVQEPVQARINMGTEPDKSEASAAEKQTKELVKQANTDAGEADNIAGNATKYTAVAGPTPGVAVGGVAVGVAPVEPQAPTPVEQSAPVPDPGAAAEVPVESPASASDPEALWFSKLQSGLLHYAVPTSMEWKVASTITVTIDGERASPALLPDETGQASIKVARAMTVQPSCPDNPDEFTFTPEPGTTPRQYVSADGTTTWQWSVVPKYTGTQQKIKIQAWVVYSDKDNIERELPVYGAVVDVHVPGFWECAKRLLEGRADYWLNYGLPGGAGFIFVSSVLIGLWKRRSNKKNPAPAP